MGIDFKGRVAIVTGAGGGLGRQHALALAARGAKVLVNDLGGAVDGKGGSVGAAQAVVDEIIAAGGEAIANGASVTDYAAVQAMVQQAVDAWGRVDILVNNAGILRDKSFSKMEMDDFRLVVDVHLMGAAHCCKAVWPHMVAQQYGRIVMTTSSTGLYGNFGQSNYGAAKLAQVGLMQTLSIEGAKYNIHVNALAPTAATRMTEGLMPQEVLDALTPEAVVPAPAHRMVRGCGHLRGGAHHADPGYSPRHGARDPRATGRTPLGSDRTGGRTSTTKRRSPGDQRGEQGHGGQGLSQIHTRNPAAC
jgi:NAD(P)-dependent dehydrogenase (short-subunit alcohol dehydrogenase family)